MEKHMLRLVESRLEQWRQELRHTPNLYRRLCDTIGEIEAAKTQLKLEIPKAEREIEEIKQQIAGINLEEKNKRNTIARTQPPSSYSVWSYWILIIGSLLVGIVTAWYYLGMQIQLQAAKMGVPVESTLEFLHKHPEDGIYGLGVVVFLLTGKIVSEVYKKLNHSIWLFLPVSVSAVATTVGTVILIASISAIQQEMVGIDRNIIQANPPGLLRVNCTANPTAQPCVKVKELEIKRTEIGTEMASKSFWMTILVMIAEILLGSAAWMLASEHHEKHGNTNQTLSKELTEIQHQLSALKEQRKEQEAIINSATEKLQKIEGLLHKFEPLRQHIPGHDYIDRSWQRVIDTGKAVCSEVLNACEQVWAEESARLHAQN